MPRKFYSTNPLPFFCWICGGHLHSDDDWQLGTPPLLVSEKEEWQQIWKQHARWKRTRNRPFAIHLPASELSMAFQQQKGWYHLFRMILEKADESPCRPSYSLSGIGDMDGARAPHRLFFVPLDPEMAYIGCPGHKTARIAVVARIPHPSRAHDIDDDDDDDDDGDDPALKGYLLHARCWDLLERQLGSRATQQLDYILAALKKFWSQEGALEIPRLIYQGLIDFTGKPIFMESQRSVTGGVIVPYPGIDDPFHIPAVNELLHRSRVRGEEGPVTALSSSSSSSVTAYLSTRLSLPLEIKYAISDYLDATSVRNMLLAFGESLPVSYWLHRIPTTLYMEIQDKALTAPETIDWPYLTMMVNDKNILGDSLGIWNRSRILAILTQVTEYVNELDTLNGRAI
ncbi:hypothetical protein ASPZODRAFT_16446 [Penicilliopsis zonata CBS 506.65]|uniref:Uncharacterized protein n=1 Tax=Penicilliopsis zonata CBS 506.65 TaxID=1073090 RepID=A0A1L9SHN6_9EURO|nr:hypothetical protein ASPZODRAFT_16446 [Penicilliopsis zonata CBS 506.65]OJJ46698.1 hypothetical protein ASPZODRAFT_16446 [Penicilliopsis zonata CBS 506.65]